METSMETCVHPKTRHMEKTDTWNVESFPLCIRMNTSYIILHYFSGYS